ncbi:hypothetical protein L0Y34_00450 [Candidatus Parcubacteria bacterium]|nr:hypothetical protein [Candidatus Parcubacteria bacterium]
MSEIQESKPTSYEPKVEIEVHRMPDVQLLKGFAAASAALAQAQPGDRSAHQEDFDKYYAEVMKRIQMERRQ